MKTRVCVDCSTEMGVPNNSSKLRCEECLKTHNKEKAKSWYHNNPRACRKNAGIKQVEKRKDNVQYRLLSYARKRARETGHEFSLEEKDILIPLDCPILGTEFEYGSYYTHSIDRLDNSKGYIKGNIQVVSHKANAMKNSATPEELVNFAKWILNNYEADYTPLEIQEIK